MQYLAVDLFYDFQCVGGACINTCCVGWNISIDENTYQKMVENEEILGVAADDWLEKKDKCILAKLDNGRCYMLNENNLCNVVLKLGPEYLSQTCTVYPRTLLKYGYVMEGHMKVSCPEIISKLMDKERVQFELHEDEEPDSAYEHMQLYLYESAVRSGIIGILQHTADVTLSTRIFASYNILEEAISFYQEEQIDFNNVKKDVEECLQENVLLSINADMGEAIQESDRYKFLRQLQEVIATFPEWGGRFSEICRQVNEYFARNNFHQYIEDMQKFRTYVRDKYHNFYINYWVCRLFADTIAIPDYEKAREKYIYVAAEFCLFQIMAFVTYVNHSNLDREEYIYMISFVSRTLDHSEDFRKNLMKLLKETNIVGIAGLLMMIISE